MLKYKYIFQIKYTEAILSNSTRKLLWFEITKLLIAVLRINLLCHFIIIFGTLSFPVGLSLKIGNGMECELTIGLGENGNVKIHCRSSL